MKELPQDEIRKIAYNCRKATFLIEKQQLGSITIREKLELSIHLTGCSICRIFQDQSIAINQAVKNLFHSYPHISRTLDEPFKRSLKDKIEQRLNGG